jgi:deazaflavin-dependent oxidoreductase (nitroreductase family)
MSSSSPPGGARRGKETSTPLFYARDADRLLIAASFAGSGVPPGWYLNLVAHPDVQVTTSGRTERYRARTLSDAEAEAAWPKLLAVYPPFARYRQRAQRTIPVIVLRRTVDDRLAGVHVMEEPALPRARSTTIANTSASRASGSSDDGFTAGRQSVLGNQEMGSATFRAGVWGRLRQRPVMPMSSRWLPDSIRRPPSSVLASGVPVESSRDFGPLTV